MIRAILVTASTLGWLSIALPVFAETPPKQPIITSPVYTKAVRLVDVGGGRRINLYCRGTGSPAVIFDAGLSDTMIAWARVQPAIGKTNATCSYDRAGLGFSDASDRPGTAANDVDDIHKALQVAHIKPPYLLVGHSAGGMAVRVFADRHRDDVVGMVIVDGAVEDQSMRYKAIATPEAQAHWNDDLEDTTCMDAARHGDMPKDSPVYERCVGKPDARYSQAINDANLKVAARFAYQAAVASEARSFDGASSEQARATRRDFGDMPIIVLTRSAPPPGKGVTQAEQDRRTLLLLQMHNELAGMSTHGVNEIVPRTGHLINYDRPDIVVDAIHQALAIAAEQAAAGKK